MTCFCHYDILACDRVYPPKWRWFMRTLYLVLRKYRSLSRPLWTYKVSITEWSDQASALEVLCKTRGKFSKNPSSDGCTYRDLAPQLFPRIHQCTSGVNYGGTADKNRRASFVVVLLRLKMPCSLVIFISRVVSRDFSRVWSTSVILLTTNDE